MSTRKVTRSAVKRSSLPAGFKKAGKVSEPSPGRKKKVNEKEQMQDLNKRLEFYILNQREKDAARTGLESEVDAVKDACVKELAQLTDLHDAQIKVIRKNRDDKVADNARMKEENNRQTNLIEGLKKEAVAQKKYRDTVEDRNKQLAVDLQQAQAERAALDAEMKILNHDLTLNKSNEKDKKGDVKTAQDRADKASKALTKATADADNLKEDLDLLQDKYDSESERRIAEIAVLTRKCAELEDDLRREFGRQLKEILTERQQTYEQEKEAGLAALRDLFEEELNNKRDEIDKLNQEVEGLHTRLGGLESELAAHGDTAAKEAHKAVLEGRVNTLAEQLREARQQHSYEVGDLNKENDKVVVALRAEIKELKPMAKKVTEQESKVRKLKDDVAHWSTTCAQLKAELKDGQEDFKKADKLAARLTTLQGESDRYREQVGELQDERETHEKDYSSLLDVKVALDMEITSYRELLTREEERLQVESPRGTPSSSSTPTALKKRKRGPPDSARQPEEKHAEASAKKTKVSKTPKKVASAKKSKKKATPKKSTKGGTKKKKGKQQVQEASAVLKITEMNLDDEFIKLTNEAKSDIVLDGWSLKAQNSRLSFQFPDADAVKPGQAVTIWLGSGHNAHGRKKRNFVWAANDIWDPEGSEGDACLVFDPTGEVTSRVDISME